VKEKFGYGDWVYVEGGDLPVRVLIVDGAQFLALQFDSGVSQSRSFPCATVELVAHPDLNVDLNNVCEGLSRLDEEQRRLLRAQARGRKPKLPFQFNETALRERVRQEMKRRPGCR